MPIRQSSKAWYLCLCFSFSFAFGHTSCLTPFRQVHHFWVSAYVTPSGLEGQINHSPKLAVTLDCRNSKVSEEKNLTHRRAIVPDSRPLPLSRGNSLLRGDQLSLKLQGLLHTTLQSQNLDRHQLGHVSGGTEELGMTLVSCPSTLSV